MLQMVAPIMNGRCNVADISPAVTRIKELLERNITSDEYRKIRDLWFQHVENEEHLFVPFTPEEGERYLDGVMATLSQNCLFRFPNGERWQGQDEVRKFYRHLITAFKDFAWSPQCVVVGPQGVIDIVQLTARQLKPLGGISELNQIVTIQWVIHFPWNPTERKLDGEIVYVYDLIK